MTAVMKVENLRMEFGGLIAVKEISFEVNEGEFIGLIGPNGCGKSTTFNCISGLLNQTSGKIEIFEIVCLVMFQFSEHHHFHHNKLELRTYI